MDLNALEENNWNEQNCRPEVILAKFIPENMGESAKVIENVLLKNGYRLIGGTGHNFFFVENDALERLKKMADYNFNKINEKQISIEEFYSVT